jgi:hypothetical protein
LWQLWGGEGRGEGQSRLCHVREHFEDKDVHEIIILKWISKKWNGRAWSGLIWFVQEYVTAVARTVTTFVFHTVRVIY